MAQRQGHNREVFPVAESLASRCMPLNICLSSHYSTLLSRAKNELLSSLFTHHRDRKDLCSCQHWTNAKNIIEPCICAFSCPESVEDSIKSYKSNAVIYFQRKTIVTEIVIRYHNCNFVLVLIVQEKEWCI